MGLVELFERSRSGVVQVLHVRNGDVIGSGSGFFVRDKLVTNHNVAAAALLPANIADTIAIRLYGDPENQARCALPAAEFAKRVSGMSEEQSFDYLIADVPEALPAKPYQFDFAPETEPAVGQLVAFQGYPFGQAHLASHAGYVSSIYDSGPARMIQLDANVNSGNSGGPSLMHRLGKFLASYRGSKRG